MRTFVKTSLIIYTVIAILTILMVGLSYHPDDASPGAANNAIISVVPVMWLCLIFGGRVSDPKKARMIYLAPFVYTLLAWGFAVFSIPRWFGVG